MRILSVTRSFTFGRHGWQVIIIITTIIINAIVITMIITAVTSQIIFHSPIVLFV